MVLFAMIFASFELGKVFAKVYVVEVVAVAFDVGGRVCFAYPFGDGCLYAAEYERSFSLFEICDPVVHDIFDSLIRTERLNAVFFVFPCGFYEKAVFILCPFDMICFAPHEQVRECEVRVFAVLRPKIGCDKRAVCECDRLKFDVHRNILLDSWSALGYDVRLVRILRADPFCDTKSAAFGRRRFCAS